MFHKSKTEEQRQSIFDEYLLSILKNQKVIQKNKLIVSDQESYDPTMDENAKGAFDSYVDTLVVKNFLIEQIYSRLKINKNMAVSFVNKLNGNQVIILSKVVNEFITEIKEKYESINDYILKTSFDELQANYNVKKQNEKNEEIVRQNQAEQGKILQDNIPEDELKEEDVGDKEKMIDFLNKTIFKLEGVQTFGKQELKKTILYEFLDGNTNIGEQTTNVGVETQFRDEILQLLVRNPKERVNIQQGLLEAYKASGNIPITIKKKAKNIKIVTHMEGLITGGSYGTTEDYISIGKYKAHKTKLMGGNLQMRSKANNQIHNFKSQTITKSIRDILLKLNKDETINFGDVDKLTTEEKDQLYMIGKKLHITQLFDIPSTLKSQEDKLKDEFVLLRGSLFAGNNNPLLLRKFKIVLLKMKNHKLISLQEYNEVLHILLEMDI
jgi:hypothetical protein